VYTGANAGAWVKANAVALISTELTWREAYLYTGIGAALVLLPFAAFAVRPPRPGEGAPDAAPAPAREATEAALELSAALRTRTFWALALGLFAFFFYFVAVVAHFVPYLQDQGMDVRTATAYYTTAVSLGLLSKPLYGALGDRLPARAGLLFNSALYVASALLMLYLPDLAVLWMWIAAYGLSSTARDVVYPLIIIDSFGVRHLAPIYGALMLALTGGPLGAITAAYIHDRTGSYDGAFALFAGLNLVGFLALFLVRRETAAGRALRREI